MSCPVCFEDPNCGWCSDVNLCVLGNSTGPAHGQCDWNYFTCPTTTTTTTKNPTPPPTSQPPESLRWTTKGTYLTVSTDGTVVTRTTTAETWTSAWVNTTGCSSGQFVSTIQVVHFYDDPANYYNAVMGLVSVSCADSYTGYNIDEIIGWTGSGGCGGWSYIAENGDTLAYNSATSYGVAWNTAGTNVTMTADLDAGTLAWSVNGVSQGTAYSGITLNTEYYIGVSILAPTTSFKILSSSCSSAN